MRRFTVILGIALIIVGLLNWYLIDETEKNHNEILKNYHQGKSINKPTLQNIEKWKSNDRYSFYRIGGGLLFIIGFISVIASFFSTKKEPIVYQKRNSYFSPDHSRYCKKCGREIPFGASECVYCLADQKRKRRDQKMFNEEMYSK